MFSFKLRNIYYCFISKKYLWHNIKLQRNYSLFINEACPKPEFETDYLCNPKNKEIIEVNIKKRKGVGDINRVQELYNLLNTANSQERKTLEEEFIKEAHHIPNKSHPNILSYGDNPKNVKLINEKKAFDFKPKEFNAVTKGLKVLKTDYLGNFSGHRSYYFLGDLAEMEKALIKLALENLIQKGYKLITVPDLLPRNIIESCGMNTKGDRTQVYELDSEKHLPDMLLSGTSEMALAGYFMNKTFSNSELPTKHVAVSRCYRAETSRVSEERGIYRVHQFTKVEMFSVTNQENSHDTLEEFRSIQEEFFSSFGLHLRTLDMPLHELGPSAYRKYDVEAWFPGREMFGEVSSCSNCTDYQARRLNIKYKLPDSKRSMHVHTVNGTACAIPRMLIALLETHQQSNGSVIIPEILQPLMNGKRTITKNENLPKLKVMKEKLQ